MRRRYLAYLILVVLPSLAAVVAGVVAGQRAWDGLRTASWNWVGTVALNALQTDLVGLVDSLGSIAEPTPVDADDPVWDRIAAGETVSALRPGDSGAEVLVLAGPRPDDPPGSLRYAAAPLPSAPVVVARAAGSRLSLYLNGRRVLATRDSLGPETVPRPTLVALSAAPGGLAMSGEHGGALVAMDHPVGLPPSVAVMVGPMDPPGPPIPLPLLLVTGLLFLFGGLVGWIQLGAGRDAGGKGLTVLVVSLVPVLTSVVFLVQTDRLFQEAARAGTARSLTRTLAVARVRGILESPAQIHELTGFQAARVRDGQVEATTLTGPMDAIASLPAPPPSFTSSGTVTTSDGPSIYVALRLSGGGLVVASARRPDDRTQALRRTLVTVGGVLGAWLLVTGWMVGVGSGAPRPADRDQDPRPT